MEPDIVQMLDWYEIPKIEVYAHIDEGFARLGMLWILVTMCATVDYITFHYAQA